MSNVWWSRRFLAVYVAITVAVAVCGATPTPASGDGGKRLSLKIIRHQPCNGKPSPSEKVRFASSDAAPLENDESKGSGCYVISGEVSVLKTFKGQVQVYAETKIGTEADPEDCHGADSKGCGGVGSCVYCDACNSAKNIDQTSSGLVHLETGDKRLECDKTLSPGNYNNIKVSFCMPTKKEFLQSQKIDETVWDQISAKGHLFFITLYLFEQPVNGLSKTELRRVAQPTSKSVIGCHKLVGSLIDTR